MRGTCTMASSIRWWRGTRLLELRARARDVTASQLKAAAAIGQVRLIEPARCVLSHLQAARSGREGATSEPIFGSDHNNVSHFLTSRSSGKVLNLHGKNHLRR